MNYLVLALMGVSLTSCTSGIKLSAEMKIVEGDDSIEFEISKDLNPTEKTYER